MLSVLTGTTANSNDVISRNVRSIVIQPRYNDKALVLLDTPFTYSEIAKFVKYP